MTDYNHPGFTATVSQRVQSLQSALDLAVTLEKGLKDGDSYAIDHSDETLAHLVKHLRVIADNTESLRAYAKYPSDYSPR